MACGMKLSRWRDGKEKPDKVGFYRVQDFTIHCNCCWIDAHWDGKDWHTKTIEGVYRTLLFFQHVTRWRGLAAPYEGYRANVS